MRVLNKKPANEVHCTCGAHLEFEDSDVKLRYYSAEEPDTAHPYVVCPECGTKCEVSCSRELIRELEMAR